METIAEYPIAVVEITISKMLNTTWKMEIRGECSSKQEKVYMSCWLVQIYNKSVYCIQKIKSDR